MSSIAVFEDQFTIKRARLKFFLQFDVVIPVPFLLCGKWHLLEKWNEVLITNRIIEISR